jgi:hypothetical protein
LLREWDYSPPTYPCSAQIRAALKDDRLNTLYSFDLAEVDMIRRLHDVMIAHRLWNELGLPASFGADPSMDFGSQPLLTFDEEALCNQLSAPKGDIRLLLDTPADRVQLQPWEPGRDMAAALARDADWLAYRDAARRLDAALRLYELPDLAPRILQYAKPGEPYAPVSRDVLTAALTRAASLVGRLSIRFPGPAPTPLPAPPAQRSPGDAPDVQQ